MTSPASEWGHFCPISISLSVPITGPTKLKADITGCQSCKSVTPEDRSAPSANEGCRKVGDLGNSQSSRF